MNPDANDHVLADVVSALLCDAAKAWLNKRGWDGTAAWVERDLESRQSTRSWEFVLNDLIGTGRIRFGVCNDGTLTRAEHAVMQSYLRAAAWLATAGADPQLPRGGDWVLADRTEVVKRMHDLNNRLNSLISNASVLATAHPPGDRLNCFSQQMTLDSERSAEQLVALSHALLDART